MGSDILVNAPYQAVLLAGGLGSRLGELTKNTPKPLLGVGGRPFLEYLTWNLTRHGIRRLVLSIGFESQKIIDHFKDGESFGIHIDYVIEPSPMGTGGAVKLCEEYLEEQFFVLNGDTLFDINYLDLMARSNALEIENSYVALRHVEDVSRYGAVAEEGERVVNFSEKSHSGPGWINGGVYWLKKKHLDFLPSGVSSLESDLFPMLAKQGLLYARPYSGFFIDIGTPATFQEAQTTLPEWRRRPVAFLDRDGVINHNTNYACRKEEFIWMDGAAEAIKQLNDRGYLVIVITNQAGIGRGYYTEGDFWALMQWVNQTLNAVGAHLDAVYFCPCHPEYGIGKYKKDSFRRKPNPGMFIDACNDWDVDLKKSFFVGDAITDEQAAERQGLKFHKFESGDLNAFIEHIF